MQTIKFDPPFPPHVDFLCVFLWPIVLQQQIPKLLESGQNTGWFFLEIEFKPHCIVSS